MVVTNGFLVFFLQTSKVTKSDAIHWQINFDRFNEYLRDQAIVNAVAKYDMVCVTSVQLNFCVVL